MLWKKISTSKAVDCGGSPPPAVYRQRAPLHRLSQGGVWQRRLHDANGISVFSTDVTPPTCETIGTLRAQRQSACDLDVCARNTQTSMRPNVCDSSSSKAWVSNCAMHWASVFFLRNALLFSLPGLVMKSII